MKRLNKTTKIICIVLAVCMIGSVSVFAFAKDKSTVPVQQSTPDTQQTDTNEQTPTTGDGLKKSETVFVNLDPTGKPYETIVSDWIHSDTTGAEISDRSDLKDIINVKGEEKPVEDGNNLTWKLEGNDLYYQGTTEKQLPVSVNISYKMDGVAYPADEMAGKSGKMEMTVTFQNNLKHDVVIGGKTTTMYTPFIAVAALALPDENFRNVQTDNGSVVADGNNQAISLICLPGLEQNLGLGGYSIQEINDIDFPETFTITADVTNFSMGSVGVALVSGLPNLDDIKSSTDIESMKQDLNDLKGMQNDLEKMDPNRELRSLFTNQRRVISAQTMVDDLFTFYDMNTALFDILPNYVTEANIRLYDQLNEDLDKLEENSDIDLDKMIDDGVITDMLSLVDDLDVPALKKMIEDCKELDSDEMKPTFAALEALLNKSEQLQALMGSSMQLLGLAQSDPQSIQTLNALADCSNELMALVGAYQSAGLDSLNLTKSDIEVMVRALLLNKMSQQSVANATAPVEETPAPQEEPSSAPEEDVISSETSTDNTESDLENAQVNGSSSDEASSAESSQAPAPTPVARTSVKQRSVAAVDPSGDPAFEAKVEAITNSIWNILASAQQLDQTIQSKDITPEKMQQAVSFLTTARPLIQSVADNAFACSKELSDFMTIMQTPKFQETVKDLKKDMADNKDNLSTLNDLYDLCEKYHVIDSISDLTPVCDDLQDLYPTLKSLREELNKDVYNKSLHQSPESMKTLLKMKDDLFLYKDISESLRIAVQDKNVALAKNAINTLDRLQAKDAVGDSLNKMDDIDFLMDRKDAIVSLSDDYKIFTDVAEGMDSDVKFVMKTDEIKAPEIEEPEPVQQEESKGFFGWIKGLFSSDK